MKFLKSFGYAGRGIVFALRERNFRFHLCAMIAVVYLATRFYQFSAEQWAILLLTCGAVLALETVNTAIEHLCDKVSPEQNTHIRMAKDCSAGAVLISAIIAVAVGAFLFRDSDVFGEIGAYFSDPLRLVVLIVAVGVAFAFVFLPDFIVKKKK